MVRKFYTNKTDTMLAVEKNGCALEYASADLRADREVVMAAVSYYGWALEYASEELRKDRDIVMAAAEKDACALMFASLALRADKSVVLEAMIQDIESVRYAKLSPKDMQWVLDLLPAKSAIDNRQEADSKILGCVGMLLLSYEKKQGLIDKSVESTNEDFRPYYEDIASYISARDIGLFSQLSTNYYVEDINKKGKPIKRAPRRMNSFGTPITMEDTNKGVKRFIEKKDIQLSLRRPTVPSYYY